MMGEACFAEVHKDARALRKILPVYAGKGGMLTAVLQYVYQAIKLGGSGCEREGRAIEEIAGEKLRDFEMLGTLITRLGANPVFTACPPYPVSYHSAAGVDYAGTYAEMLAADIRLEEQLEQRLGTILDGLGADPSAGVVALLRRSCCSHAERLRAMLAETEAH